MDSNNTSAVSPSKEAPVNFTDALSKAKAIAEKLKSSSKSSEEESVQTSIATTNATGTSPSTTTTPTTTPTATVPVAATNTTSTSASTVTNTTTGTKRNFEEDREEYQHHHNPHENKRSAYDMGSSRPYYATEPQRHGLGSDMRKPYMPYSQHYQEDYSVPNHMVGLLIGKGGENLKKIERMSGVTKVQFDNDPIGNERVVHIIGEPDQIAIARDMIRQMVSDAQVNDNSRTPHAASINNGGTTITIRIPSNKVGLVIGRGGETIRDFQERTKAKIMIASDSYGDRNHERVLTLVGDDTSVGQAKALIEELIFGSSNPPPYNYMATASYEAKPYTAPNFYGYGTMPRPDDDRALIPVPAYAVGLIIGKGGETVRSMQEQSGARVKVDQASDPNSEQRIVNISGDPKCVAIARQLVEEKVTEANRTLGTRPGSTAVTAAVGYTTPTQAYYAGDYNQYYAQYGYNQQQFYTGNEASIKSEEQEGTDYYGHQAYTGASSDQEAYYQWYQQYYGQQQYGSYSSHGEQPSEDPNSTDKKNDELEVKSEKKQDDKVVKSDKKEEATENNGKSNSDKN